MRSLQFFSSFLVTSFFEQHWSTVGLQFHRYKWFQMVDTEPRSCFGFQSELLRSELTILDAERKGKGHWESFRCILRHFGIANCKWTNNHSRLNSQIESKLSWWRTIKPNWHDDNVEWVLYRARCAIDDESVPWILFRGVIRRRWILQSLYTAWQEQSHRFLGSLCAVDFPTLWA